MYATMIGGALGGVGLFLLGMSLLTDGLQAAAGDRLRQVLKKSTSTRLSSVMTGLVATAVVQSSSATTLIAIGFVGAGLLTLPAALGVLFGANVGTTLTSWIVAGVGLKVKMNTFALPIVGAGALIRLFTRGRRAALGSALAGFGLIFVGIDVLQATMQTASEHIDLARLAGRGFFTLAALVLVGAVMTVVMQSSSAAVATTLAAVHSGTIGLIQAAALVIGQNVGTTVTAGLGAIGGSAVVRRTALAHLIFNVVTAAVALALLPGLWPLAEGKLAKAEPALLISAFHTAFNVLGLALFVPFIFKLAAWLERHVEEHGAELTQRLATGRGASPAAVLEACRLTAHDIAGAALDVAVQLVSGEKDDDELAPQTEALDNALDALRNKMSELRAEDEDPDVHRRHVATLHALDHLHRLVEALEEEGKAKLCLREPILTAPSATLVEHFRALASWTREREGPAPDGEPISRALADTRKRERAQVLERTARGEIDPEAGERLLESLRWVDRLGYHSMRAHHHLELADHEMPLSPAPAPESRGRRADESHGLNA